MVATRLLACLLLVGCEGAGVSYHVGVSHGVSSFDTPVREFGTNTIYFGVGFAPFEAAAYKSAEDAELRRANRAERMEFMANESAERAVHMEMLAEADLLMHKPGADLASVMRSIQDDAPEDEHVMDYVPPIADTTDAAWPFLIWAAAMSLLAAAAGGLWWIGFPLPFVKPRKSSEGHDGPEN